MKETAETEPVLLPPKSAQASESMKAEKTYRTGLSNQNYLMLEVEAMHRGITAYKLTQAIVTLYLTKQLVYVPELPEPIRNAIEKNAKVFNIREAVNTAGTEPSEPV